jgi:hypothetical protein
MRNNRTSTAVCIVAKLKTGIALLHCWILVKQTSEFSTFDMPPIICDFYAKTLSFRQSDFWTIQKLSITQRL